MNTDIGQTLETHVRTRKGIQELQECVDALREDVFFAPYVAMHTLRNIDDKLEAIDKLLDAGILRA